MEPKSIDSPNSIYYTLDGARGVAAICVVIYHASFFMNVSILPSGYLGVDLFFVLSGFVLAHVYELRFAAGMEPWRFMALRVARLYPLYILGALVGAVSAVAAWRFHAGTLRGSELIVASITAIFMAPTVYHSQNPDLYPLNGPSWSLLFELVANLIYVVFWRQLTNRVLGVVVAVSAAMLIVIAFHEKTLQLGGLWSDVGFGLPRVCFSFFAGVGIFRLLRRLQVLTRWAWCLPLATIPIFALAPSAAWRPLTDLFGVLICGPALVMLMSWYRPGPKATSFYALLGQISFAVYAIHYPLMELSRRALRLKHIELMSISPAWLLVFILALGLMCYTVEILYDRPVRKLLLRILPRSGAAPVTT